MRRVFISGDPVRVGQERGTRGLRSESVQADVVYLLLEYIKSAPLFVVSKPHLATPQEMFIYHKEQYLFNVFEVIVSTLESKLQRIDNLDKAVEHLMRRVEMLDSRVTDNIDKTDSVINKLSNLDLKLFHQDDILDSNVLNAELMNHVSREFDGLRAATDDVDKKLQFHINIVSDNLEKVLDMVSDVHDAVVEPEQESASMPQPFRNRTMSTTTPLPIVKSSKLDKLVRQMHPILSVSEKMDEVWDVVVGTKSSVDDLVPKSDELLTQTQRQERAINDIHADLRTKANKIIANLDMVEKRLKKQEEDVVTLAQRPVPAELLLDPTIDRLVEYDVNRYTEPISQEEMVTMTETPPPITFTTPITTQQQITQSTFFSNNGVVNTLPPSTSAPATAPGGSSRVSSRNRGVIFPSVKNKPSLANSTFTTDLIATIKDVKRIEMKDSGEEIKPRVELYRLCSSNWAINTAQVFGANSPPAGSASRSLFLFRYSAATVLRYDFRIGGMKESRTVFKIFTGKTREESIGKTKRQMVGYH
uniref:(California timema) hypothetical protein n=1 Tax=Timema californicum TaxID=61474 RepID=A0A7R9P416_TIMCA|nr:unnamed protein product [Timema californicum]